LGGTGSFSQPGLCEFSEPVPGVVGAQPHHAPSASICSFASVRKWLRSVAPNRARFLPARKRARFVVSSSPFGRSKCAHSSRVCRQQTLALGKRSNNIPYAFDRSARGQIRQVSFRQVGGLPEPLRFCICRSLRA
jgi:hypothetical protein